MTTILMKKKEKSGVAISDSMGGGAGRVVPGQG